MAQGSARCGVLEAVPRQPAVWTFAVLTPGQRGETVEPGPARVERLEAELRRLRGVIDTYSTMLGALAEPCPCHTATSETGA